MREQLRARSGLLLRPLPPWCPPERAVYEKTQAERQSKRLPPHPVKRLVSATGKPRIEEARYLAEVEESEYRVLKLRYDAAEIPALSGRCEDGCEPPGQAGYSG